MSDFSKYLSPLVDESSIHKEPIKYAEIFDYVQKQIINKHLNDLNSALKNNDFDSEETLKKLIKEKISEIDDQCSNLVDDIYNDMTSFGFLNKYFADKENIEEININCIGDGTKESPGCIIIEYCNGKKVFINEHFHSIKQGVDVLKRMLQKSDEVLDNMSPMKVTYLGDNIRLSIAQPPICNASDGIVASIRFTHPKKFTKTETIKVGTLTKSSFNKLEAFINNGVSIAFSGDTGSGKTTLMNTVLSKVRYDTRLVTLEDGTHDFDLKQYDEHGRIINDVVHLYTRPHPTAQLNIRLEELLDFILRFHPKVICVGEMVSEEAFIAQETARTGHTVITSLHSISATDAYERMYTLALRKYELPKNELLELIVKAFPISVQMNKYQDGKRRVEQIVEAVSVENGKVKFNVIDQFIVTDNMKDADGNIIKVIGHFENVNNISDNLKNKLIRKGMSLNEIDEIFGGENVDELENVY
ncbi:ATPase, T2SS/T4P/T4SS family [Paludicola sp. MB14-C6]|uniref:ATPase, T2SS/T4P/T4SS family n=1 Tax=Paludihabitans sp. MB14-C6 TaxID=3070656 RepID=UPI0027DBA868|nr:ATPase, T2SS/T4P/T4SS family [Paludicola sp. MB14-C6]WMJ22698.1 ATPase, T2SS/T4P/T4SS family [Paludicola sp. MB14-C6]